MSYTSASGGRRLADSREGAIRSGKELRRLHHDFFGVPGGASPLGIVRIPPALSPAPGSGTPRPPGTGSVPNVPRVADQGRARSPLTSSPIKVYPKLTPEVLGISPRRSSPESDAVGDSREPFGGEAPPASRPESVPVDHPIRDGSLDELEGPSDHGMRDLWRDGIHQDVFRDRGAQDIVRDRGLQDLLRLGARLSGGLPTEIVLFASAARSGGFALGPRRAAGIVLPPTEEGVASPTPAVSEAPPAQELPPLRKRPRRAREGAGRDSRSRPASTTTVRAARRLPRRKRRK